MNGSDLLNLARGDLITADLLNELIRLASRRITGSGGIQVFESEDGNWSLYVPTNETTAGAEQTYATITQGLSLGETGHSTYLIDIDGGESDIIINRIVQEDTVKDMRHFLPWFPTGQRIPVVKIGDYWRINSALIYTGGSTRSLTWNTDEDRAMGVWA